MYIVSPPLPGRRSAFSGPWRGVTAALTAILLAGCASAPVGEPAPVLSGRIQHQTYFASDDTFAIGLPHVEAAPIKERRYDFSTYVSFGPKSSDPTIYRVEVAHPLPVGAPDIVIEELAPFLVDNYKAQLEKGYGQAMVAAARADYTINGYRTLHWRFTQLIPASDAGAADELTHYVYILDGARSAAVLWVQVPKTCRSCETGAISDLGSPYPHVDRFVRSFRFNLTDGLAAAPAKSPG